MYISFKILSILSKGALVPYRYWYCLTHWGRVTHNCVGKLTIIGSDNGLSPGRRQAIIITSAGILLIGTLGTNFSEILSEIHTFSFKKMHLKMSSGKRRPFCLGLNVLSRRADNTCWTCQKMKAACPQCCVVLWNRNYQLLLVAFNVIFEIYLKFMKNLNLNELSKNYVAVIVSGTYIICKKNSTNLVLSGLIVPPPPPPPRTTKLLGVYWFHFICKMPNLEFLMMRKRNSLKSKTSIVVLSVVS